MTSLTIIFSAIIVLTAAFAGYVYIIGISPETKRKLEEKALETMGENKASYMTKDMLGKVPDADQQELKELKGGLGNVAGAALQNPLGKFGGDVADEGTRPATGR